MEHFDVPARFDHDWLIDLQRLILSFSSLGIQTDLCSMTEAEAKGLLRFLRRIEAQDNGAA